jgi:hypothetical protein
MNSYLPLALKVTVMTADFPGWIFFVPVPVHVLAFVVAAGLAQTLKSWTTLPLLVTLKVTLPTGSDDSFDSLNASSEGCPAVTLTTVTFGAFVAFT